MPDHMTAEALHALVSQWPVEARDKDLVFNPMNEYGETLGWECEGEFITDRHAIALHEASGLRWLIEQHLESGLRVCRTPFGKPPHFVVAWGDENDKWHEAPTLIDAIHAAIMATAKEEA